MNPDLIHPTVTSTSAEAPATTINIAGAIHQACAGLDGNIDADGLTYEVNATLYEGASHREIYQAMILAARAHMEHEPAYKYVAARLLLNMLYSEALGEAVTFQQADEVYNRCFDRYLEIGIQSNQLTSDLQDFDLAYLKEQLQPERDLNFQYAGLQTVYDRYLLHHDEQRFELPQLM